jgi:small-conductance mechanosensitive channel
MIHLDKWMDPILSNITATAIVVLSGIMTNWILQLIFRLISKQDMKLLKSKWHPYLAKRKLAQNILLLIPGLVMYLAPYIFFEKGDNMIRLLHRLDLSYLMIVLAIIANSIMLAFLDIYSTTEKNRSHPLQGLVQGLQVILCFITGIIVIAILIDKSPTVLLTGLGASAAVLMLVFKDSILGFVAGVQLSQNNMIKLGDWIQLPDGSANGTVEQITLNTVKIRNWDNTISMIPPYTLVTSVFKNWRGMQESGGRRVDKCIFIDMNTLETCTPEMISDLRKAIPLMGAALKNTTYEPSGNQSITNIQLYRMYIDTYLRQNKEVNTSLDIIITQKEATAYGLPIEVYFFLRDKRWAYYEQKQSDIFDHLMTMAHEFGLHLYQRP